MNYFSQFNRALTDLQETLKALPASEPGLISQYNMAILAILTGQRFYVPEHIELIAGKVIDDEIKTCLHLPYECVCVLNKQGIEGADGVKVPSWVISVGIDIKTIQAANPAFFAADDPFLASEDSFGYGVMTIIHTRELGRYAIYPFVICVLYEFGTDGLVLVKAADSSTQHTRTIEQLQREFNDDVSALQNMCIMLSLSNVTHAPVAVPDKLNRKYRKHHDHGLLDYHVLVVDGERYERVEQHGSTGHAVRSHLRRGHIRRLPGGKVWVKQTTVHGHAKGFVKKDYVIK